MLSVSPSATGAATVDTAPAVTVSAVTSNAPTHYYTFFAGNATSVAAGTPVGFYVVPEDASGNDVNSYTGTAEFTSSDLAALLPANATFTLPTTSTGSEGIRVNVTFNTTGSQTITATDTGNASISGSSTINVTAAPPAPVTTQYQLSFAGSATSVVAGTPIGLYITPETASGTATTNYTGTVRFNSSDLAALLPANTTFSVPTSSTATSEAIRVNVTFNTVGSQTLSVTDTSNEAITSSTSINVTAAPAPAVATQYKVTFASSSTSVVAGTSIPVYVTPETASGGSVNNYTGTAAFTSSDLAALLPANTTFTLPTSSTGGEGIRVLVTFNTVGTQTVTATDTVNPSITGSASINVTAAPAPAVATQYHVFFAGNATSVAAGTPIGFYVVPETASGAAVNNYTGTAGFTSSDLAALLPPNTTFTLPTTSTGTEGIRVNVTFNTVGSQTLTATDTANSTIFGTGSINVTAAPPAPVTTQYQLSFAGSATSVVAGTPIGLYITPETASGTATTNYTGTVRFNSSDLAALLPANTTFSVPTSSTATSEAIRVNVTFNTVGSQTLSVTDTSNEAITSSTSINVTAAPAPAVATQYKVTFASSSTSVVAGTSIPVYVTPETASGGSVNNYTGTAAFTSSDLAALLPANTTFTLPTSSTGGEGIRVLVTFNTVGTQTVTATDTVNPSITGSASINVTAAPAPAVATQYHVFFAGNATSVAAGTPIGLYVIPETASGSA